ncbi:hypothetical protein AM500_02770 [Bacillus sp. FJAT-18017]|nr:hypothetical protein AM500_02770 [Bacillus sp. FJAT-18017]
MEPESFVAHKYINLVGRQEQALFYKIKTPVNGSGVQFSSLHPTLKGQYALKGNCPLRSDWFD